MKIYKLAIAPRAVQEIQNAIDYYDGLQLGLGKRFHQDYKRHITSIRQYPYARAVRYADIRFAVLDKFPYAIHYSFEDNIVTVLAVLSMFQDPGTSWVEK